MGTHACNKGRLLSPCLQQSNLRFSQYNLGLVFHTIYSGMFHPCYLLLLFPLLHFPPLQFCPYRIFYSRIFSRPFGDRAFSVRAWNRLPTELKLMGSSTTIFKHHLKDILIQLDIHFPLTIECAIGLIRRRTTNAAVTVTVFYFMRVERALVKQPWRFVGLIALKY